MTARLALVLDPATPPPTVHALLQFAAGMGAELSARLLEDQRLLFWAALPFTREVLTIAPALRSLDDVAMARALGRAASACRQLLEAAAVAARLPLQIETVRGDPAQELARAMEDADVVVGSTAGKGRKPAVTVVCRAARVLAIYDALLAVPGEFGGALSLVVLNHTGEAAAAALDELRHRARHARLQVLHAAATEDLTALLRSLG
jgi:hypothetical protein